MTNTNTTNPAAKKPIFRKQLPGGIGSAVFENTRDGRTYRSVNLQRSYRKDGKWNRMSMYLDHEHIPFIIEALEATWRFLNENPISSTQGSDGDGEPVTDADQASDAENEIDA